MASASPAEPLGAAIVGGGISGLAAATAIAARGETVACFEAAAEPGGSIRTLRRDGFLFELGPNTVLDAAPEFRALIESAGLSGERLEASPAARKRFVVQRGRLVPLPSGPISFLTTPLFSFGAKLRILREPFVARASAGADESIAEFTRRRLGPEVLDYAVGPFVSGVYAGDPERLSVRYAVPKLHALEREHGSLVRGAMKKRSGPAPRGKIVSFRSGLDALPRALAARLGGAYRGGAAVTRVRRVAGVFEISLESGGTISARRVVVALPPAVAARVVDHPDARDLARVPAASLAVVALGFRRDRVRHALDGFGCLVPRVENREILGCLFPSSLFPGRAPEGHVALSAFAGGALRPDLAGISSDAIREHVLLEVEALLGTKGEPAFCHVERWPGAIPQFERGHGEFLDRVARIEAAWPGLRFAGNWLHGVSVGDCVRHAASVASGG